MLGSLEEQVAMDRGTEAGDNDGGHVLQGQLAFALIRSADELPVAACQRTMRRVDANDVE